MYTYGRVAIVCFGTSESSNKPQKSLSIKRVTECGNYKIDETETVGWIEDNKVVYGGTNILGHHEFFCLDIKDIASQVGFRHIDADKVYISLSLTP